MDINIHGRDVTITDRFRNYVDSKVEKIASLLPKAQSFEVRVSRTTKTSPEYGDRVELTLVGPGPVVRAEASGSDKFAAFDLAHGKALEQVRRVKDKRKIDHKKGKPSLANLSASDFKGTDLTPADIELIDAVAAGKVPLPDAEADQPETYTPIVIRSKSFPSETLTVEEAIDKMELVGHDFFLFVNAENSKPSVAYRRRGWNYGIISLDDEAAE